MNRFNVQFTAKQRQALDKMAEEIGATKVHVLKKALGLLSVAVREKKQGNQIGITKNGKVIKEIIGF